MKKSKCHLKVKIAEGFTNLYGEQRLIQKAEFKQKNAPDFFTSGAFFITARGNLKLRSWEDLQLQLPDHVCVLFHQEC